VQNSRRPAGLLSPCLRGRSRPNARPGLRGKTARSAITTDWPPAGLEGEWNAVCRFRLPDGSWGDGPGSLTASKVLDGCVSLEFFEGTYRGTIIKGLGLRAFNPQTSQWEHTWDDETGRHVLFRLSWSRITERSAHWESHARWMAAKLGPNTE
jgi:hypothetical protein